VVGQRRSADEDGPELRIDVVELYVTDPAGAPEPSYERSIDSSPSGTAAESLGRPDTFAADNTMTAVVRSDRYMPSER